MSAKVIIDHHGEEAATHAAMMADKFAARNNQDAARVWHRIMLAIYWLQDQSGRDPFKLGLLPLFVLAVVLDKPAILSPLALIVPAGLAYGGWKMFGWKGAAVNVAGLAALSILALLILGTDPHHQ